MSLPVYARFLPLLALLSACASAPNPQAAAPAAPPVHQDYPQGIPLFQGTLHREGEQAFFTQCGNPQRWQLQAGAGFWQQWRALGSPATAYVELEGELALGEARGAPLRLKLKRLNLLSADTGSACRRDTGGYDLAAFGSGPDWRLHLLGEHGTLTTPTFTSPVTRGEARPDGIGALVYLLKDPKGRQARLRFEPANCRAPGQEPLWGYRVTLQDGRGLDLQGCGERGRPLADRRSRQIWHGQMPLPKQTLTLTLQPNYQATLVQEPVRGPTIHYAGAWQPSRDGLRLLFNHRQGRGVREIIPLQQQGTRLDADYRLLNGGQVYYDPPLQLAPGQPAPEAEPQDEPVLARADQRPAGD